ncbi:hypothetical protein [Methylosinus sp. Sm6]|uniref:hypothetical protein n=1 Tax=Methylosinus sp. Sm6 TaxID=2866948 RepID=UPI001C9A123E|nr:hypothetical protein [Methylosinus sp. Sm6]MBY6242778.1 hypothetical protein [Methylosinus sp. Sm6]
MDHSATERREIEAEAGSIALRTDATFERIERHMRHIRWMLALTLLLQLLTLTKLC